MTPAWRRFYDAFFLILVVMVLGTTVTWLRSNIIDLAIVDGSSMSPTLIHGEIVLIDKISDVEVGDLIAFQPPDDWRIRHAAVVKRVVAFGPSQISCCDANGSLVVNSAPVRGAYASIDADPLMPFDRYVPDDTFWAIGDNTLVSDDSISHVNSPSSGSIPNSHILGKVVEVQFD